MQILTIMSFNQDLSANDFKLRIFVILKMEKIVYNIVGNVLKRNVVDLIKIKVLWVWVSFNSCFNSKLFSSFRTPSSITDGWQMCKCYISKRCSYPSNIFKYVFSGLSFSMETKIRMCTKCYSLMIINLNRYYFILLKLSLIASASSFFSLCEYACENGSKSERQISNTEIIFYFSTYHEILFVGLKSNLALKSNKSHNLLKSVSLSNNVK